MRTLNKTDRIVKELHQHLANHGFKSSTISIQRLRDVQHNLENLLEHGTLDGDFYNEIVSRYDLHWNFEPPSDLPEATSVIVTAVPQPKVNVEFNVSGTTYGVIMPPTYAHDTDEEALNIISRHLGKYGYEACAALLPVKPLAVHSGLASYGRNNIAYIKSWGSFVRLRAFFSDMPCTTDTWHEAKAMTLCTKCVACVKKCPTSAIQHDRFLIHAQKCMTFFNEKSDRFPEWVDPAWHNCLIGCMKCQDACPANKDHTAWVVHGGGFSEEETLPILRGVSRDQLSAATIDKLKRLYILEWYDVLQRNLEVLINRSKIMQRPKKPKKK